MGTPAQVVEQGITNGFDDARLRRQQLEDEQRKATLKTLQEDAETPADKLAAIQAVYHKDPGVLKQHVENMTRKLLGKPTQPVVTPQQAQQARIAPIAARGKTPNQQALDLTQQTGAMQNKQTLDFDQQQAAQKQKQTFDLIDQYIKDPEQNKAAKEEYARKQAGIMERPNLKEYVSPDGKQRQWFDVSKVPDGWQAAGGTPKPSSAALATYIRARFGDTPTAEQIAQATRDHQALMSGLTVGSHQTIAYDADGVPHVITLSNTSRKDFGGAPAASSSKAPAPRAAAPKAAGPSPQPGHGQLDFRKATPQSTTAKKAVDTAENSYLDVQKASRDPTPVGDQGVILAWLRGRVNRVTATEIDAVNNLGGAKLKMEGNIVRIESGKMTDQQRAWFLRSAKDNYDNAQQVASKYNAPAPKSGGGKSLADRLNEALQ